MIYVDWHFLALDQHGTVYSWGGESGGRGSLGLGPQSAAKARGVNFSNVGQGRLETPTEVWFGDGGNLTGAFLRISPSPPFLFLHPAPPPSSL